MATFSTFLGLRLNASSDPFLLSDFIGNWTILDGSPGVYVCTNSSRPAWGTAQAGRLIFMTDWKCLSYWTGTTWADNRDAAPVFAAGTYLNTALAAGTSTTFNILTLTTPRACGLAIILTGTYLTPSAAFQDVYQRIVVDGVGSTGNQLGGFREQIRFSPSPGIGGLQGECMTSLQVIGSVSAGTHTIAVGVDVSAQQSAVTLNGAKCLAFMTVSAANNSL